MAENQTVQLPDDWEILVREARLARKSAYAPYSGFEVGACLKTDTGQLVRGCNVENSSYGLTICAERVAVTAAIAAGERKFVAMCVSLQGEPVPCGACRQFLYEFHQDLILLLDDVRTEQPPECALLSDLLPRGFRLS